MDVFELFWRHAIRYCSLSHFFVALSSLRASQICVLGQEGGSQGMRRTGWERTVVAIWLWLGTSTACCAARILWSLCSLSQRPLSQWQLLQVSVLLCCSVLITNRTEPQSWTCKTFATLVFPTFKIMSLFFFSPLFLPDYYFKNNTAAAGFINMHTVQCKWLLRPPLGGWFNVAVMKAAQTVLD